MGWSDRRKTSFSPVSLIWLVGFETNTTRKRKKAELLVQLGQLQQKFTQHTEPIIICMNSKTFFDIKVALKSHYEL